MARSQLKEAAPDLVLAFAPSNDHFQDFIEGVRLVTGEEGLIGVAVERVVTNELFTPQACVVAMIRVPESRVTIATAGAAPDGRDAALTEILTTFRAARGNLARQYDHRGTFIIEHAPAGADPAFPLLAMSETALDAWFIQISPRQSAPSPVICRDRIISTGRIATEILAERPWGVGVVETAAFPQEATILAQAAKTALRDAANQMDGALPAFGLLFLNEPSSAALEGDFSAVFREAQSVMGGQPLVGILVKNGFFHVPGRPNVSGRQSVAALLVPA